MKLLRRFRPLAGTPAAAIRTLTSPGIRVRETSHEVYSSTELHRRPLEVGPADLATERRQATPVASAGGGAILSGMRTTRSTPTRSPRRSVQHSTAFRSTLTLDVTTRTPTAISTPGCSSATPGQRRDLRRRDTRIGAAVRRRRRPARRAQEAQRQRTQERPHHTGAPRSRRPNGRFHAFRDRSESADRSVNARRDPVDHARHQTRDRYIATGRVIGQSTQRKRRRRQRHDHHQHQHPNPHRTVTSNRTVNHDNPRATRPTNSRYLPRLAVLRSDFPATTP